MCMRRRCSSRSPTGTSPFLVVTDGNPTQCGSDIANASSAASAGAAGVPPVRTYVLGIGPNLANLNAIAQAGGTGHAYLVESGGAASLTSALNAIRADSITCDYVLPPLGGATIDGADVSVHARVGLDAASAPVGQVAGAAACSPVGGWFFDDPARPTRITLCPTTCAPLQSTSGSALDVLVATASESPRPPVPRDNVRAMRRHAAVVVLCSVSALAVASTSAGDARGDVCSGVLSTCINDDTLWPHAGPGLFESIGAGHTVAGGRVAFGLITSYVSRPIVLELVSSGLGSDQNVINDQVTGTFLYAYGVTDRLELDVALPLTFGQGGTGLAPITGGAGLKDTAVRDLRFGAALEVLKMEPEGAAAARVGVVARFEMSAPTGDEDQFAGEQAAVYAPSVSAEWHVGEWFAGAEAGLRVRPIAQLLGARVGTQVVAAAGTGYDILPRGLLSVQIEAWALPTFAEQETPTRNGNAYGGVLNGSHITPAEWQLSVRSAPLADRRPRHRPRRRRRAPVQRRLPHHDPEVPFHARPPLGSHALVSRVAVYAVRAIHGCTKTAPSSTATPA